MKCTNNNDNNEEEYFLLHFLFEQDEHSIYIYETYNDKFVDKHRTTIVDRKTHTQTVKRKQRELI